MLSCAARSSLCPLQAAASVRRTFVSTILLSKSYDDKTVPELRAELRKRGLSGSGTKAKLIMRMQQEDKRATAEALPKPTPTPSQTQMRSVSTSSPVRTEPPPNPPAIPRSFAPPFLWNIKIPDVSQAPPELPIEIPFLPDFWDSSTVKALEQQAAPHPDPDVPKIVLTAGAATHPAGGPTYNLSPAGDVPLSPFPSPSSPTPKRFGGILGDVLDDLGIPPELFASSSVSSASTEPVSEVVGSARARTHERPLDAEEKRGVYGLLGLLVGSWLVAGLAAPSRGAKAKKAERH